MTPTAAQHSDRQWFIVSRWQEYEGESRANLLRVIAIGVFYAVQLSQYYIWAEPTPEQTAFHKQATLLAAVWCLGSLGIWACLRREIFPPAVKYLSTGGDLLLLTLLAALSDKADSPLVLAYFLILAIAGLRFQLRLIWFATFGCMLGYMALVGAADGQWLDAEHAVEPVTQLITLVSFVLTGVILRQIIRRVRGLADDFRQRLAVAEEADS